jgi:hypothetical protein
MAVISAFCTRLYDSGARQSNSGIALTPHNTPKIAGNKFRAMSCRKSPIEHHARCFKVITAPQGILFLE